MPPAFRSAARISTSAPKSPRLRRGDGGVGAVAAFIGTVRDRNDGACVQSLDSSTTPGMTEAAIEAMIDEAKRRLETVPHGRAPGLAC